MQSYKNYFEDHYKISFSEKDIKSYRRWFYAQWEFLSPNLKLDRAKKVLEIGSGFGGTFSFLKESVPDNNFIGLELDQRACKFANNFYQTNCFKNQSIEKFTSREQFDYVFAFEVLEHLEDPLGVIKKIYKLLKNGGCFIGTSPYPFAKNVYADSSHTFVLHPENWKKIFTEAGFSEVKTFPISFFPFLWRVHRLLNVRIPFYVPFPYFISTCLIVSKKT